MKSVILNRLIKNTPNVCFIAFWEEKPIASIIAFYNQYYMHGHIGGALSNYLNMSPYSLLYSEMIKYGQVKGCRYLHVGGGTTSKKDDPLLKYKMNFSDISLDFFIGKKIHNEIVYSEILNQWEKKYPESYNKNKNMLLGYRELFNK